MLLSKGDYGRDHGCEKGYQADAVASGHDAGIAISYFIIHSLHMHLISIQMILLWAYNI